MLTGSLTGKRPLGRQRRRWEDNLGMDFKEIGINTINWFDSVQDRKYLENSCQCAIEPPFLHFSSKNISIHISTLFH